MATYVGLIFSPEAYQALIPGVVPYDRPPNPGPLDIAGDGLTQYQLAQAQD